MPRNFKTNLSVVKDVDLEAMPTSILLNDDDDDQIKSNQIYLLKKKKKCAKKNTAGHKGR